LAPGEEVGDDVDAIDETSVMVVSRDVSDSSAELREEEPEDTDPDALRCARRVETSGALYDSIFVVDRRATGEEIFLISTGLSEYLMLAERPKVGDGGLMGSGRLRLSVNALAIDMTVFLDGRESGRGDSFRLRFPKFPEYQVQTDPYNSRHSEW